MGGTPPTRPVASGNAGMNLHLSEIVSKILTPIANHFDGGIETISGEDILSKIDELNSKNKDWQKNGGGGRSQHEGQLCPGVDYAGGCEGDTPPPLCICDNHKPSFDDNQPSTNSCGLDKNEAEQIPLLAENNISVRPGRVEEARGEVLASNSKTEQQKKSGSKQPGPSSSYLNISEPQQQ